MRRVAFVLLCVLAAPLAAVVANHYSCNRHEAAFQAKFQQLSWDAREGLKVGTPKGEELRFFSENHFGGWSDQSHAWGHVYTTRGGGSQFGLRYRLRQWKDRRRGHAR